MDLIDAIKQFIEYGIFAGLFIYLFMYSQRRNEEREKTYTMMIEDYGAKLKDNTDTLKEVCNTLDRIKEELKNDQ